VEVVHAIWAARDTFGIQKHPTVISGRASRGGASSWPTHVVISVVVRWQLDLFFFTLFSLFFTHPKLKYFLTFCIISIAVLILFYYYVFALNSFYDFFFNFIFYFFIFMLDLILFLLIDIYFAFHPSSNWFSFQFHTWFFFNLVPILLIIISSGFIYILDWFFFQIHPSLFDFIWF